MFSLSDSLWGCATFTHQVPATGSRAPAAARRQPRAGLVVDWQLVDWFIV
jgi:hypothetical protein